MQFFDRVHIDDPVGATAVHLCCGVFGTICVGLFSQEGVTSLSTVDGLFFGGGFGPLGIQLLGVVVIGAFSFLSSGLVWLVLKKTIGIRVSPEEEIQGLDIGEHGNVAYPDFALAAETVESGFSPAPISAAPASQAVPVEKAVPVEHLETPGAKITKVTILTNPNKFSALQEALDGLGITGITVTNVFGYGVQHGHTVFFRGNPVESRLLPKVKIDIVVCKVPVETLLATVQKTLYTGNIGDGKVFLFDVEDVLKIRTGERGYDALQDEPDASA